MLKYALYPNRLTQGEDDYRAIPQSMMNEGIEEVIGQITIPGSILKETECVAVIHEFFRVISENLKNGKGFVSDYIRIQPSVRGVFQGLDDKFDPDRHQKQVMVNAAKAFKDAVSEMKLEKVAAQDQKPVITSVFDFKTGTSDKQLTPGHMVEVCGNKLKIDRDKEDEGIYLLGKDDNSETVIETVYQNFPGKLSMLIPDNLKPGQYILEVRNRMRNNLNLSKGFFPNELVVL
jgi:hypothetical protein